MSKFKVGDKVKCIEGQGGPYCLMYGEEYIIVDVPEDDIVRIGAPGLLGESRWRATRFELVSSPTETKQLPHECKCGIYRNDCVYHKD